MKVLFAQICLIISLSLGMVGCFNAPEYSPEPKIKLKDLKFIDTANGVDSLRITFDFEDGDGDIGIQEYETYPPFHPFYLIADAKGDLITLSMADSVIDLPLYAVDADGYGFVFSETDNRPEFNCDDYYFGDDLQDTFYILQNQYHNNFILDFLFPKDGVYQKMTIGDFRGLDDCAQEVENYRIPIFDGERLGKPTTGAITFSYTSRGLSFFLAQDSFKLRFYIYDRQLNQSNIVETEPYALSDILK